MAVVVIHITAMILPNISHSEDGFNYEQVILVIFNLLARFSVPAFLLISGFLISVKFENNKYTYKNTIKKQSKNLLLPYFTWTIFGLLIIPASQRTIYDIVVSFLGMGAFYQLYYIPLLFQLYLLTPIIIFLAKKNKNILIFTTFCLSIVYLFIYQLCFINNFGYLPNILSKSWQLLIQPTFPSQMIYYVIGCVVFLNYKDVIAKINNIKIINILILWFLSFIIQIIDFFISYKISNDLSNSLSFFRVSVVVFSIFSITLLYKLSKIKNIFQSLLYLLGRNSFGIFLSHVFILKLLYSSFPGFFKSYISMPFMLLFVLFICVSINFLTRSLRYKDKTISSYIIGR